MSKLLIRLLSTAIILVFSAPTLADSANCDVSSELDCDAQLATEGTGTLILGAGIGDAVGVPDYVGSDETRNILLPLPYISYNGPRLRVSRSGITGKLFNSEKWFLSLSLSGAIPVDSEDNRARAGMEDLEAVIEYGPSLKYFFKGQDNSDNALFFDFNLREARTFSFDSLNINSSPSLVWRHKLDRAVLSGEVKLTSQIRWEFVSDDYAQYFYGVGQQDVTASRPLYSAQGGFAGYRINNSVRWQKDNLVFSFFVGYANISGASFADSPLVKRQSHVFAGSALFWLFDW